MAAIDLLDDLLDVPSTLEDPAELERYAQEARDSGSDRSESAPLSEPDRRSARGPCALCSKAAERRCLRCDAFVCPRHHHVMFGLCDACTRQDTDPLVDDATGAAADDPFADSAPRTHAELDLDWIE